jgi:alpha-tubulin suppressor-like RCC1 family protein
VANITSATAIGSGDFHSCAVLTDGTAQCWGFNGDGELGIGTTTGPTAGPDGPSAYVPVAVLNLTGATAITGGSSDTCALAGSTVACWGNNVNGELGNGTTTNSSTPVVVPAL